MRKVILDTDPGVDDALAIAMAVKSGLKIIGITTVFGNSTVEDSTRNTMAILMELKCNVPVYQGSKKPLKGEATYASSHGENALGGFSSKRRRMSDKNAIDFIRETLETSLQTIDFICIGPTTNLATVVKKWPRLSKKVGQVIILGGVFGEKGNISEYAEFNVYNDPVALQTLLSPGVGSIVLVPANVCRKVIFTQETFESLTNPKLKIFFKRISEYYIDYYKKDKKFGGFKGAVMYDLLAVAYLLSPEIFQIKKVCVEVETKDRDKYGQTRTANNKMSNCKIVENVDAKKVTDLFINLMNS